LIGTRWQREKPNCSRNFFFVFVYAAAARGYFHSSRSLLFFLLFVLVSRFARREDGGLHRSRLSVHPGDGRDHTMVALCSTAECFATHRAFPVLAKRGGLAPCHVFGRGRGAKARARTLSRGEDNGWPHRIRWTAVTGRQIISRYEIISSRKHSPHQDRRHLQQFLQPHREAVTSHP
jgi:hypothetical protein